MNTINFQPTGIYPQIAKNPAMLCASTNSKQETPVWENKNYKIKKNAIKALIIGGIIAVGAFIGYYNKGMKAINLKNKVIPKLPEDKTFQKYIDARKKKIFRIS